MPLTLPLFATRCYYAIFDTVTAMIFFFRHDFRLFFLIFAAAAKMFSLIRFLRYFKITFGYIIAHAFFFFFSMIFFTYFAAFARCLIVSIHFSYPLLLLTFFAFDMINGQEYHNRIIRTAANTTSRISTGHNGTGVCLLMFIFAAVDTPPPSVLAQQPSLLRLSATHAMACLLCAPPLNTTLRKARACCCAMARCLRVMARALAARHARFNTPMRVYIFAIRYDYRLTPLMPPPLRCLIFSVCFSLRMPCFRRCAAFDADTTPMPLLCR